MLLNETFDWYCKFKPNDLREEQLNKLIGEIEDEFNFDKIICIETGASHNWDDGCVGAFFAKLCEKTNGEFHSVEIDEGILDKSKKLFKDINLKNVKHYCEDSVQFLTNTKLKPNLVHLDSSDLNLKNPIPSAFHAWQEFCAIEDKMPVGSLIIVDDNYFGGTWVDWKDKRDSNDWERLDIKYPIIGKAMIIYHAIETIKNNWIKISYDLPGVNDKIIFKKI